MITLPMGQVAAEELAKTLNQIGWFALASSGRREGDGWTVEVTGTWAEPVPQTVTMLQLAADVVSTEGDIYADPITPEAEAHSEAVARLAYRIREFDYDAPVTT